jgi:small-conductance mechanosensitive channel
MLEDQLLTLASDHRILTGLRALLLIVLGLVIASVLSRLTRRALRNRFSAGNLQLSRRIVYYGVLTLFVASALRELGFSLAVIMGAAGVLTVALGFASQTSASNLISGLFLIGERPFSVGDFIQVSGITGEVLSIDALSVKLRTFDNLYVRIPNETLIKSEVITLTRFAIRRYDMKLGVAYKEDIRRVREVLMAVADANPCCLDEPEPLFIFLGFGESSLDIQFSVWATRQNFLELRNSVHIEVKEALDAAGIEIPFPHRSLYAGEATEPFPVRIVDGGKEGPANNGAG